MPTQTSYAKLLDIMGYIGDFLRSKDFKVDHYTNEYAHAQETKHETILKEDMVTYLTEQRLNIQTEYEIKSGDHPKLFETEEEDEWKIDLWIDMGGEIIPIEVKLCNSDEDVDNFLQNYAQDVYKINKLVEHVPSVNCALALVFGTKTEIQGTEDPKCPELYYIPGKEHLTAEKSEYIKNARVAWTEELNKDYFLGVSLARKGDKKESQVEMYNKIRYRTMYNDEIKNK